MIPERDDDHDGDDDDDDDDDGDDHHDGDEVAWVCRERQALVAGNQEHTDQLQTALYSSGRGNPHSWS